MRLIQAAAKLVSQRANVRFLYYVDMVPGNFVNVDAAGGQRAPAIQQIKTRGQVAAGPKKRDPARINARQILARCQEVQAFDVSQGSRQSTIESPQSVSPSPQLLLDLGRRNLRFVEQVGKLLFAGQAHQVIKVTLHSFPKAPGQVSTRVRIRLKFVVAQRVSIKQRNQVHLLTVLTKLASHFESDHAAERMSPK